MSIKILQDKVAFVTGAASGIGFAIAEQFAKAGAKVVLSDLNDTALQASVEQLRKGGYETTGIRCDVTKETEIEQSFGEVMERFGKLDILVNNAGLQYVSPIEDFPTEKFELLIKVMLTAPFIAIKHAFPIMKRQTFGRILNVSSINGLVGFAGKAAYNSAKHGTIGLTKVAALEAAEHGITVNALCPGYVDTPLVRNQLEDLAKTRNVPLEKVMDQVIYPLVPQKRLLSVEEIADYAVFLASDLARGVTGQAVVIDGGYIVQ
jgi:3-hydroxybutyrate dehydrogenase